METLTNKLSQGLGGTRRPDNASSRIDILGVQPTAVVGKKFNRIDCK